MAAQVAGKCPVTRARVVPYPQRRLIGQQLTDAVKKEKINNDSPFGQNGRSRFPFLRQRPFKEGFNSIVVPFL